MDFEATISKLEQWHGDCPHALVALSGGVDSSLVAFLAHRFLGTEKMTAVISASASLKLSDLEAAKDFCQSHRIPLTIVKTPELLDPNYFKNPTNRCYACKSHLYDNLKTIASKHPGCWILNGTNIDDHGDYRPGLQAADESQVRSPITECGINKEGVRLLAQHFQLACWDKPASPCLSSRIPYGERVTEEKLRRIEKAEDYLNELGFSVCRVRHCEGVARIEVPEDQIVNLQSHMPSLRSHFETLGFKHAELDMEGFISGKLNRVLG